MPKTTAIPPAFEPEFMSPDEQAMLDRQARKHALEARLSTPLPAQEIGELGLELKQVDEELAGFEERWLALSEQIEAEEA